LQLFAFGGRIEYHFCMPENLKSAETKKVPEAANTKKELPHVQELKKLDTTSKQLDSIRQKQGVSR
jgi:hypothetical protein